MQTYGEDGHLSFTTKGTERLALDAEPRQHPALYAEFVTNQQLAVLNAEYPLSPLLNTEADDNPDAMFLVHKDIAHSAHSAPEGSDTSNDNAKDGAPDVAQKVSQIYYQ